MPSRSNSVSSSTLPCRDFPLKPAPLSVSNAAGARVGPADHRGLAVGRDCGGTRLRAPGPRLQRRVAPRSVPLHELVDPAFGDPRAPGDVSAAAPLENDRLHHIAFHAHRATPVVRRWPLCPATSPPNGGHYVVKPHTLSPANLV